MVGLILFLRYEANVQQYGQHVGRMLSCTSRVIYIPSDVVYVQWLMESLVTWYKHGVIRLLVLTGFTPLSAS